MIQDDCDSESFPIWPGRRALRPGTLGPWDGQRMSRAEVGQGRAVSGLRSQSLPITTSLGACVTGKVPGQKGKPSSIFQNWNSH